MKFGKLEENVYLVRFERGEALLEALKTFCKKHEIKNATLSAIGALDNPILAYFNHQTKQYQEKKLEGTFELTSLLGSIAVFEEDIIPHCHVTISDESLQVFGGHLTHGVVGGTVEMTVTVYATNFEKKMNEEIGLKLFDLPEE